MLLGSDSSVGPGVLDRYVIGPLTGAELWSAERENMELDRGPCGLPFHSYDQALVNNLTQGNGQKTMQELWGRMKLLG